MKPTLAEQYLALVIAGVAASRTAGRITSPILDAARVVIDRRDRDALRDMHDLTQLVLDAAMAYERGGAFEEVQAMVLERINPSQMPRLVAVGG